MSNVFVSNEMLCLFPRGSMGYEEWLITLPSYLREIITYSPENKTYTIEPIHNPDHSRVDKEYWRLILRSHGLGMNRGTEKGTSSEEEKINREIEDAIAVAKAKRGRPFKEKKNDFSRSSIVDTFDSFFGNFSFRVYGSKPHSVGTHPSSRNNSVRSGSGKGDRGMLVYSGGNTDLIRLEEKLIREKSGRVRPQGHGPTKDE